MTGGRCLWVAALLSALATAPAAAQMSGCAAAQTQAALNDCAHQEYQKNDAALHRVAARLDAKLTKPDDRKALAAAEHAWTAYRDAECAFETGGTADGTLHPMLLAMCLNEKTLVHIAELTRQLSCNEGDLSCVH